MVTCIVVITVVIVSNVTVISYCNLMQKKSFHCLVLSPFHPIMLLKMFSRREILSLSEYWDKPLYLSSQVILGSPSLLMVDNKVLSIVGICMER